MEHKPQNASRTLLQQLSRPLLLACLLGLGLSAAGLAVFAQRNVGEESRLIPMLQTIESLENEAARSGGLSTEQATKRLQDLIVDPLRAPLRIRLLSNHGETLFDSGKVDDTWLQSSINSALGWLPVQSERIERTLNTGLRAEKLRIELTLNAASELREAAYNFGVSLLALSMLAALLYGLARTQLRVAFAPLSAITQRLQALESGDCNAPALPWTQTQELNLIAQSVNHLQGELAHLQARQQEWINRLADLQESERRQIAAELHDELGQHLTALQFDAATLMRQCPEGTPASVAAGAIQANSRALSHSLKGLLLQLRPVGLDGAEDQTNALRESLERMVADWQGRMPECQITLALSLPRYNIPSRLSLAVFRLVQEALTNAARHSQGTQIDVAVHSEEADDVLNIAVCDNGRGLPPRADPQAADAATPHLSAERNHAENGSTVNTVPRSLMERTRANGGTLVMDSPDGGGCRVTIQLPLYRSAVFHA